MREIFIEICIQAWWRIIKFQFLVRKILAIDYSEPERVKSELFKVRSNRSYFYSSLDGDGSWKSYREKEKQRENIGEIGEYRF